MSVPNSIRRKHPFDSQPRRKSSASDFEIIDVSPTDLSGSEHVPENMSMGTILERPQAQPQASALQQDDIIAPIHAQSFITHQRRPAIIPADADLSAEDELAVRMRTGVVNPKLKADGRPPNSNQIQDMMIVDTKASCKRKASLITKDDEDWVDVEMQDVADLSSGK